MTVFNSKGKCYGTYLNSWEIYRANFSTLLKHCLHVTSAFAFASNIKNGFSGNK